MSKGFSDAEYPRHSCSDNSFLGCQKMTQRILYLQTPKTGGTSVETLLRSLFHPTEIMRIDGLTKCLPSKQVLHAKRVFIISDIAVPKFKRSYPSIWDECSKFGVCRDPYSKLLSAWKYCESTKHRSLSQCLRFPPEKSWWRRYDHDYVHFTMLQSDFLLDSYGNLVVDQLLRFESLQCDISDYLQLFGITDAQLPRCNIGSSHTKHPFNFSKNELALVNERYSADFGYLGYRKISVAGKR